MPEEFPEFLLKLPNGGPTARGRVLPEKGLNGSYRFLARAGSGVRINGAPSISVSTQRLREQLLQNGTLTESAKWPDHWELTRDVECNSPSGAASLLTGRNDNGLDTWRDSDGHPLADYLGRGWRAPHKAWLVRGSNVSGHDLVRHLWLTEHLVSLAGAHLPRVDEGDPTKSTLRAYVQRGYGDTASYHQKLGLADDLHAFLTEMRPGDLVCTISAGRLHVGTVTGPAVQADSPGGLSNLRRTADWLPRSHPYAELPEEVQQKLSVQRDVVDLTAVAEPLRQLAGVQDAGDGAPQTAPPSPRELALPEVTDALAADLLVHDPAWLAEVRELLWDERQLVLYGPPGTGKTHLALKLAEFLGGGPEQVTLVQFHPSYAYEDFFEGFRPQEDPDTREVAFRLAAGPLRELADRASREGSRHLPHFLVVDEINRANLAKVFGELYFLLEYRNRSVRLTYSGDDFALPPNLFVIGTMNTADRSIALVDAAMRRRFAFVELSPRTEPTRGLLHRWLEREQRDGEAARLLDALNSRIGDPDFAIGPTYLMTPGARRPGGLERTWRTKILPLLEEHHYGEGVDVEQRYGIDALRGSPA